MMYRSISFALLLSPLLATPLQAQVPAEFRGFYTSAPPVCDTSRGGRSLLNLGNGYLSVGDVSCELTSASRSADGLELLGSCLRGDDDVADGSLVLVRNTHDGVYAEFRGAWKQFPMTKAEFFRCVPDLR